MPGAKAQLEMLQGELKGEPLYAAASSPCLSTPVVRG